MIRRRIIRRVIIMLLVCTLVFGGAELAVRSWIEAHTLVVIGTRGRDAYADKSFWSDEFVAEMNQVFQKLEANSVGQNVVYNLHGKYINTNADGFRIITGQPTDAHATMYVFGSSITWGYYLPDWLALPSQLQRLMPQYRVLSEASLGGYASVQLARLHQIALQPGDLVIWLDGYQDIDNGFAGAKVRYQQTLPSWIASSDLSIFRLIKFQVDNSLPPDIADEASRAKIVAAQVHDIVQSSDEAAQYVAAHGGTFYSFIEPSLLAKPMTDHERGMWNTQKPWEFEYTVQAWNALRSAPGLIDLSGILSNQREEVYIDCCHMNDMGATLESQAIYDYLTTF